MTRVRQPAAPTQADVALSETVRDLCGRSLCAGEWPREAMLPAMRLTCDIDDARDRGDEAEMVKAAGTLLDLARDHMPDLADAILPPLPRAA